MPRNEGRSLGKVATQAKPTILTPHAATSHPPFFIRLLPNFLPLFKRHSSLAHTHSHLLLVFIREMRMGSSWCLLFLFALLSFSSLASSNEEEPGLMMNFYKDSCPQAEDIIREQVKLLYKRHKNTAFSWLRNIFHDCAVEVHILLKTIKMIKTLAS